MELERVPAFGGTHPLSWAVCAGDVIHVAGMVGTDTDIFAPAAPLAFPDGVEAQLRQAYRNIGRILERVGASLADIADQTVFFACDPQEATTANKVVRAEIFGDRAPASSTVIVSSLFDPRCLLEMKVTAYRGAGG